MLSTRSRYNRCAEFRVTNAAGTVTRRPYLDIWPRTRTVKHPDDGEYQVLPRDNWSRIAARGIGRGLDWWIVADANRVIDPWKELHTAAEEGATLRMPSVVRAFFDYQSFDKRESQV